MGPCKLTSNSFIDEYYRLKRKLVILKILVIFAKIRTREPGPVLGNLDLNRSLLEDPYTGIRARTRESGPVVGNFLYSCTQVPDYRTLKKPLYLGFFEINVLILSSTLTIDAWLFCHVPWVIEFESGLKKIGFIQRY